MTFAEHSKGHTVSEKDNFEREEKGRTSEKVTKCFLAFSKLAPPPHSPSGEA